MRGPASRSCEATPRVRGIVLIALLLMAAQKPGSTAAAGECWNPPVAGTVIDPFRAPACTWCEGNRGIEYDVASGTRPRAVAAGTVSFSGVVAGERYVVVDLPSGWKLTYGRLVDSQLRAGDAVVAGSIVGSASGPFFFGLRIDGEYVDPSAHLGHTVGVPRLIPVDGRRARPSTDVRLVCAVGVGARRR
jgi:murein DD-endopeptidase MepM/ murein hydrolase activator NlpD